MMSKSIIYSLFLVLVFSACGEEDQTNPPVDESFIQETPIDGCNNHVTTNLDDTGLTFVRDFYEWGNLFFFSADNELHVRSGDIEGNTIIQQEMYIRKFQVIGTNA